MVVFAAAAFAPGGGFAAAAAAAAAAGGGLSGDAGNRFECVCISIDSVVTSGFVGVVVFRLGIVEALLDVEFQLGRTGERLGADRADQFGGSAAIAAIAAATTTTPATILASAVPSVPKKRRNWGASRRSIPTAIDVAHFVGRIRSRVLLRRPCGRRGVLLVPRLQGRPGFHLLLRRRLRRQIVVVVVRHEIDEGRHLTPNEKAIQTLDSPIFLMFSILEFFFFGRINKSPTKGGARGGG